MDMPNWNKAWTLDLWKNEWSFQISGSTLHVFVRAREVEWMVSTVRHGDYIVLAVTKISSHTAFCSDMPFPLS